MAIVYNRTVPTVAQFTDLYRACTLGARRPLDAAAEMMANVNIILSAWDGELLVGLARAMTDRVQATYLADLAVRETHQKHGIGKQLIRMVQAEAPRALIVLIAAPQAHEYYGRIGFAQHRSCWILRPEMTLT
jgi:GNAT superfamily N-acetyltransferase